MSVESSVGKLKRTEKDLRRKWNDMKLVWRDENSRRLERDVISPLLARIRTTELAMGRMAAMLRSARRDCE